MLSHLVLMGLLASFTFPSHAVAEERTVVGRITALDARSRTLSVVDSAGKGWNYKVDDEAEIDLGMLKAGDRVSVAIRRGTPMNMMSSTDLLRKGDKVILLDGY